MTDQSSGAYEPMPAAASEGPVSRGPAPAPVVTAARLMYASAALGILAIIVTLATKATLKKQILDRSPKLSGSQVDTALNVAIAFSIIIGLVVAVLYVVLAMQMVKGKSWARIVTLVLAGLGVLFGLLSLVQPAPVASRILSVIGLLLDIAIIVFLTRPASSAYFRGQAAR